jgi:hypothetical protein
MTDKVFSPGEVLTAADVNDYLLNKTGSGNAIINGAFEINQRGFTSSTVGVYTFDRWQGNLSGATGTYSAETSSLGSPPEAGFDGARFLRTTITTGNDFASVLQRVEDVRNFAGQTVTVSFYAKGTNPTTAGNLKFRFFRNYGSGGSTGDLITQEDFVLTANWARYSFTIAVPSLSGKTVGAGSFLDLSWGQGDNTSTDSWTLDLWGVQLEAGSVATPFKRNANSLQGELAACQRYYQENNQSNSYFTTGSTVNSTNVVFAYPLVTTMRTAPSFSISAAGDFIMIGASDAAVSAINVGTSSNAILSFFAVSSGLSAGQSRTLFALNANARIRISAEL